MMQEILTGRLEQIYCEHCHLATPTWRGKCIHCAKPVPSDRKLRVIARSPSPDGSSRGHSSRFPSNAYGHSVSNPDAA